MKQSLFSVIQKGVDSKLSFKEIETITRWFDGNIYNTAPERIEHIRSVLQWLSEHHRFGDSYLYSIEGADSSIKSFSEIFNIPYYKSRKLIETYISDDCSSRPIYIAVEGLDGAGKTVQCSMLAEYLRKQGKCVYLVDFPQYDGPIGKEIGYFLSGDDEKTNASTIDPKSMCLWYATDRWNTLKNVNWRNYDFIIFNRYSLSSAVYQTARFYNAVNSEFISWVFELEHTIFQLPAPDVYVFLNTEISGCKKNLNNKGERSYVDGLDVYEQSTSLLKTCRTIYQYCIGKYPSIRSVQCNGNQGLLPALDIHKAIIEELNQYGITI